jgi:hypothetical protein
VTRLRSPLVALVGVALAGAVLVAALAGCGGRGGAAGSSASPSTTTSGATSATPSGAPVAGPASEGVTVVERAVREAGGTLDQADRQLAED